MKKITSAVAVLIVFLLASCGGTGSAGGSVIAGVDSFNGVFYYGWGQNSYDVAVRELVHGYGTIMTLDEGGQVHPNFMTEGREVSEDGLTQVYKFKKGLKFHGGETFTADDIVFTYEFYMDNDEIKKTGGNSSMSEYVESVEKLDDYTVKIVLKEKIYTTETSVFATDVNILSKEYVLKDKPADKTPQQHVKDTLLSKPNGLGPYKFVEYIENQWVKLAKYDGYPGNFRGIKPSIDNIVVKIVATETEMDELETGSIDILQGSVEEDKINAAKAAEHLTYNNYPRHGYGHLTFHTDFGVTADTNIRKAFGYMMDRKQFVNVFLGEYGFNTQGPYSTNYWMIDNEWVDGNLEVYTPNIDKASALIEGSGWTRNSDGWYEKDGKVLEFKIAAPAQSWNDALSLVLSETVQKEYGIKVTIQTVDFSVLLAHYYGSGSEGVSKDDRTYNAFALATTLTPQFDAYANWHSDFILPWGEGQSQTSSRYSNPETDALIMNMRRSATDEEYQKNYLEWVKIMNRDLPLLPLYSNDYHDLYNKRIKNFKTSAIWKWQHAILEANL